MNRPTRKRQCLELPLADSASLKAVLVVDLNGDVVLQVGSGPECIQIRVNSQVLKLSSTYFSALFGPNFAEGSRKFISAKPLQLEDDNPKAVLDFCNIVHHQFDWRERLRPQRLIELAILSDKYNCNQSVQPVFQMHFNRYFPNSDTIDVTSHNAGLSMIDITAIAYLLDDQTLFWRASRQALMVATKGNPSKFLSKMLKPYLPEHFIDAIDIERKCVVMTACTKAISLIEPLQTVGTTSYKHSNLVKTRKDLPFGMSSHRTCRAAQLRTADYMNHLWTAKLWPCQAEEFGWSVEQVLDRLEAVVKAQNATTHPGSCTYQGTISCRQDIRWPSEYLIIKTRKQLAGWCLSCVKASQTHQAIQMCDKHKTLNGETPQVVESGQRQRLTITLCGFKFADCWTDEDSEDE